MKIYIDRQYSQMLDFVRAVPKHNYEILKVFKNNRNTVELTKWQDTPLVIKKIQATHTGQLCGIHLFEKDQGQKGV